MRDFSSLNKWAISALHEFGFHGVLKTISVDVVVNKPLLNQEVGRRNEWGGFYHLFEQNSTIFLYMLNQVENKAKVVMIESSCGLKEILLTKEEKSIDEIMKESRVKALADPKLDVEKTKVIDFINKNKANLKDVNNLFVEEENKSNVGDRMGDVNCCKDLYNLDFVTEVESNNHVLSEFYSLKNFGKLFEVQKDVKVKIFNEELSLKQNQVLLPLKNKTHELISILELLDNGEIAKNTIVSPRPSTVNCYTLGDLIVEQSKWVFIVSDLISGLLIRDKTGVSVVVCESEDDVGLLVSELRNKYMSLKIGCFLNGKYSTNQLINTYKQDSVGVYFFNIAPDFEGGVNWYSFILNKRDDVNFSVQSMIKNEVSRQMDRVNKLQTCGR